MDFARTRRAASTARSRGARSRGELCSFFFAYTGDVLPRPRALLRRARRGRLRRALGAARRRAAASCSRCTAAASATRTCVSATRGSRGELEAVPRAARRGTCSVDARRELRRRRGRRRAGRDRRRARGGGGRRAHGARRARSRARRQRHARARAHDLRPLPPGHRLSRSSVHPGLPVAARRCARARGRRGRPRAGGPRALSADPPARVRGARRARRARRRPGSTRAHAHGARRRASSRAAARERRGSRCARRPARRRARRARRGRHERRRGRGRARRRRHGDRRERDPAAPVVHLPARGRARRGVRGLRAAAAHRRRWRTRRAAASSRPSASRSWCAATAGPARSTPRSRFRRSRAARSRRSTPTISPRCACAPTTARARWSRSCARRGPGFAGGARRRLARARRHPRDAPRARPRSSSTRDDVLAGRRRRDEVALGSWPIELWEDHRRPRYEYPQGPCSIPLGALVSREPRRCSAWRGAASPRRHEALGALRVIGTALATGEAIGVAAALAARRAHAARRRSIPSACASGSSRRPTAIRFRDRRRVRARRDPRARARAPRRTPRCCADRGGATRAISLRRARRALRSGRRAPARRPGSRAASAAGWSRARARASSSTRSRSSPRAAASCRFPTTRRGPARERFADAAQLAPPRRRGRRLRVPALARSAARGGASSARSIPPICASPRAPRASARAWCSRTRGSRSGSTPRTQALAIGPDDRILWLLPMAHHFVVSILLYLRYGATILLPASSLARPVLEFAARERATVSYASPFHYHLLAKDASGIGLDLRLAISTAEGLRADVAARFRERFGRALAQALGIIEVGLPVLNAAEAETQAAPRSAGRCPPTTCGCATTTGKPRARPRLARAHRRDLHPRAGPVRRLPLAVDAVGDAARARRLPHRRPGLVRRRRHAVPGRPPPQPHQHGGHEVLQRGGRGACSRATRACASAACSRASTRSSARSRSPRSCPRIPRTRRARRSARPLPRRAARLQDPARVPHRDGARAHAHGEGEALSG